MKLLSFLIIVSFCFRGWADRTDAEKFFAPEIKAIDLPVEKNIKKQSSTERSPQSISVKNSKENAMIGFGFGVNHLNHQSRTENLEDEGKVGWGATLSFVNRRSIKLFDSIYQVAFNSTSSANKEEQVSIGALVQWAWPRVGVSPVYGAIGLGGDHQFGNSTADNEWGFLFKGSFGLRLEARNALFSLEVSRNSRISVLTQDTDHYWSVLSGIAILY